ncbi:MAG: hypothetical protein IIX68_04830, partial [Clostridia bacterium]|nr:hypothetical protein [Clostridia bacterium]
PGESHPQQLQMESGLDLDALDGPFTNAEMAKASLKGLLMRNLADFAQPYANRIRLPLWGEGGLCRRQRTDEGIKAFVPLISLAFARQLPPPEGKPFSLPLTREGEKDFIHQPHIHPHPKKRREFR